VRVPGDVVVTGARRPEEIEAFRAHDYETVQVYLCANNAIRYGRLLKDANDYHVQERKDFVQRNLREYDWGLARIGTMRDAHVVFNEEDGNPHAAVEAIERLAARLG
jgi:hypothetical protein